MPTARGALVAGVIGRKLYVAGGANTHHSGALPTLEIYDFRARRWRAGPDMAVAREHLAGAVAGGRFYALAGRADGLDNFAVVEAFDPRSERWRRQPRMRKPRGGIGAATVGGRIVVAGGEETAGTIREVELFDPRARRWRRLDDLPTPRHGLGVVSRARPRLHARRRRRARLRVHRRGRVAQDPALSRATQISSSGQRRAQSGVIQSKRASSSTSSGA